MLDKNTIDRIVELGASSTKLETSGDKEFVIAPAGFNAQDVSKFFPPKRIKQCVNLLEAGSFSDYVNKFKTADTLIFAQVSESGCTFRAILDYHEAMPGNKPAFCEHEANFTAIETPEWKTWREANRRAMSQVDFATWLEDNQKLFVEPNGAELLELVRTLHGHQNARFNTSLRLDNGAFTVSYDEDVIVKGSSTTKAGEFELPPVIKAGIAVFQGGDKYEVSARLKSRCVERKLALFFETISYHEIVRESIMLLVKKITEDTKIVPLLGNP